MHSEEDGYNTIGCDSMPVQHKSMLGILFHCAEYPESSCVDGDGQGNSGTQDGDEEPTILQGIDLGYCQRGSDCRPSLEEWRFRNALWTTSWANETSFRGDVHKDCTIQQLQQSIWLLDEESPGVAKLRIDGSEFGACCPNTVYEGFLGDPIGDIFLLDDGLYFANGLFQTLN